MTRSITKAVGGEPAELALAQAREGILAAGFDSIDYLELRDAVTLMPLKGTGRTARLLAAAWLGDVRLIDNIAV